jgi:hypothetical protein
MASPPGPLVATASPDSPPVAHASSTMPLDIALEAARTMRRRKSFKTGYDIKVVLFRRDARRVARHPDKWRFTSQIFLGCDSGLAAGDEGRIVFTTLYIDKTYCNGGFAGRQDMEHGFGDVLRYRATRSFVIDRACSRVKRAAVRGLRLRVFHGRGARAKKRKAIRHVRQIHCSHVRYGELSGGRATLKLHRCSSRLKAYRKNELVLTSDNRYILRRCGKVSDIFHIPLRF